MLRALCQQRQCIGENFEIIQQPDKANVTPNHLVTLGMQTRELEMERFCALVKSLAEPIRPDQNRIFYFFQAWPNSTVRKALAVAVVSLPFKCSILLCIVEG